MNNNVFFGFISLIEKGLHLIILGMVLALCVNEVGGIFMGGGLPFNKLGRKLNEYHTEHVGSYISNVVKNNASKRRLLI